MVKNCPQRLGAIGFEIVNIKYFLLKYDSRFTDGIGVRSHRMVCLEYGCCTD